MMRTVCALLALALCGAAAAPEPPAAAATADNTAKLMGTWSCRDGYGLVSRVVYRPETGGFTAVWVTSWPGDRPQTRTTVYRRGPDGAWSIDSAGSHRTAPPWTGDAWPLMSRYDSEWYSFADDNTLRRSSGDVPSTVRNLCLRGETPPDPSVCVTPDLPALVYRAMEPDMPAAAQQQGISGIVHVTVSLDADGRVAGTAIASTPSNVLNASAASAAAHSLFFAARHECKPAPSTYDFTVSYATRL